MDGRKRSISYANNLKNFTKTTSKKYFNQRFTFGYQGCCWSTIIPTNLQTTNEQLSMEFKVVGTVLDLRNTAPRITLPSMWYVNLDCDSSLDLHPFDIDEDDVISCRWANENEAAFAAFAAKYRPFIKLIANNCQLKFDSKEFRNFTVDKNWSNSDFAIPIAIMMEDFQNGVKRSSMPIQFLVGPMLPDDTSGDNDVNANNGNDAEAYSTMGTIETVNCNLVPVLSAVKDLIFPSDLAPAIKKSFDIYKNGRNGNQRLVIHSQRLTVNQ